MVVDKLLRVIFIQICLCLLLIRAIESAANCLKTIESQVKDPNRMFQRAYVDWWDENRVSRIDLGGFGLEGEFPSGFKECSSSLTSLTLSENNFSGTLPRDLFAFLPYLVTLDLSSNNFSGEIPVTWSNAAFLNVLLLDHNHFTGRIPLGLTSVPRLQQFSVAHNHLTGPIPESTIRSFPPSSFEDNLDLCGFPLDPCPESYFPVSVNAAAIAAAIFFPVGATIGWFYVGALATNRSKRRLKQQHPGTHQEPVKTVVHLTVNGVNLDKQGR